MRSAAMGATVLAGVLCMPAGAYGQGVAPAEDPPEGSRRSGPVALVPTITLTNFGWDSNVFHQQVDANPAGDLTAGVRPDVQGWLRLGRARVAFRSAFEYAYFRDHPSERSMDYAHDARLTLPLARLTPYVSASWLNARQRFGFEIDERTRRRFDSRAAGVVLRLGSRTNLDAAAHRRRMAFSRSGGSADPLLSDFDDYTSHGWGITLRRDLTPLTTLAVTVDRSRDEFDLVPERNSRSVGIHTGLEFKPFALISGRAFVGWSRVRLLDPGASSFRGFVASVDLAYTLLGATRFAVEARRELSYSAMRGRHAYLLSGVRGSVDHRLGGNWEIGGRVGRHRTAYGLLDVAVPDTEAEPLALDQDHENITDYGGRLGYRLGPDTGIAFNVVRSHRGSTVDARRQYIVTRAGMSVTFRF